MGGAFIAVADDPTAASWNPGGLVQLESPEVSIVGVAFLSIPSMSLRCGPEHFMIPRRPREARMIFMVLPLAQELPLGDTFLTLHTSIDLETMSRLPFCRILISRRM
jgi:hypothetical protein